MIERVFEGSLRERDRTEILELFPDRSHFLLGDDMYFAGKDWRRNGLYKMCRSSNSLLVSDQKHRIVSPASRGTDEIPLNHGPGLRALNFELYEILDDGMTYRTLKMETDYTVILNIVDNSKSRICLNGEFGEIRIAYSLAVEVPWREFIESKGIPTQRIDAHPLYRSPFTKTRGIVI